MTARFLKSSASSAIPNTARKMKRRPGILPAVVAAVPSRPLARSQNRKQARNIACAAAPNDSRHGSQPAHHHQRHDAKTHSGNVLAVASRLDDFQLAECDGL